MPILTKEKMTTKCRNCGAFVRWWKPNEIKDKKCRTCTNRYKINWKISRGWIPLVEKERQADIAITGGSGNPKDLTLEMAFLVDNTNSWRMKKRSLNMITAKFDDIIRKGLLSYRRYNKAGKRKSTGPDLNRIGGPAFKRDETNITNPKTKAREI